VLSSFKLDLSISTEQAAAKAEAALVGEQVWSVQALFRLADPSATVRVAPSKGAAESVRATDIWWVFETTMGAGGAALREATVGDVHAFQQQGKQSDTDANEKGKKALSELLKESGSFGEDPLGDGSSGMVLVHGKLLKKDGIVDLFSACELPERSELELRTVESVTTAERASIQKDNFNAELPHGYFYDGRAYIDYDGASLNFHPRIDEFVEGFVKDENKKIKEYNSAVRSESRSKR
jgi:hypothetical protein